MLSYRHIFHAGNHADILKHISLILVLEHLCQKEKPFTAIDCNAGSAIYHLDDENALKTGEAQEGILKLYAQNARLCPPVQKYLDFVAPYLKEAKYPGSPEIIRRFLRENDKAIFIELHNTEIEILKSNINDKRISIYHQNCFDSIKALTPPAIKRGFLFMDPSYEVTSDYVNVAKSICEVQKRWNVGVICLWYPLLHGMQAETQKMLDEIQNAVNKNRFECFTQEMRLKHTTQDTHLYGSGVLFVNPTWKLKNDIAESVDCLKQFF